MNDTDISEAKTRKLFIDKALVNAGWGPIVPFRLSTKYTQGSVEEYPTKNGPADYIFFFKGIPLACLERKKVRIGPQNVLQQAKRYARGFEEAPHSFGDYHLPFVYSNVRQVKHLNQINATEFTGTRLTDCSLLSPT